MDSLFNGGRRGFLSAGVAALLWITTSTICFAQGKDRRLEETQSDVALLKRVIAEQGRRIAALEKAVAALKTSQAESLPAVSPAKIANPGPGWLTPEAWGRVKEGMSRAQVVEILGPPTTVDSVLDYQTLNYRNNPSDSPVMKGSVKLADDRVSEIDPPNF